MQAIQTSYKGYLFRSRLEARWAVFFDSLGLDWQYEVEGFQLDDGTMYLPDFKITFHANIVYAHLDPEILEQFSDAVYYVEVKPKNITYDYKFNAFSDEVEGEAYTLLVSGDPLDVIESQLAFTPVLDHKGNSPHFLMYASASVSNGASISGAACAARSARFEHGECGGAIHDTIEEKRKALIGFNDKWKGDL